MKRIIITALALAMLIPLADANAAYTWHEHTQNCAPADAQGLDVALQVATLLGPNISVTDGGEPLEAGVASAFVAESREERTDADSWHIRFSKAGCCNADIFCFKRNDARHFVVHAISKTLPDGGYRLHEVRYYISDGRRLTPVRDLPCSTPISNADFADDLARYDYMSASAPAASADEWDRYTAPQNLEYTSPNARTLAVAPHNPTPGHRTVELAWNGDKFSKRLGSMQIIHSKDFAGIAVGGQIPKDGEIGSVRVNMINENVYMLRSGGMDVARIDLKKGVIDCIIITAPGYTTPKGYGIGTKIDIQQANFVSRHGNDTFIDEYGIQYKVDGNNVCREITIKQ